MGIDGISFEVFGRLLLSSCLQYGKEEWTEEERPGWRMDASTTELFKEVVLYSLTEYIEKRRKSIETYIRDRPILDLCRSGERLRVPSNAGGGGSSRLRRTWRGKMVPLLLYLRTRLRRDRCCLLRIIIL